MGLGLADNPAFAGMHEAAAAVAGGSLAAMEAILAGRTLHAHHPGGGLHHAMADRAWGFCIYNDVALAVVRARTEGLRVLYVDLDVHHGDGVQALTSGDPGVLTLSLHESGRYLFPGTGFLDELGDGPAAGSAVNMPFEPYCGEAAWLAAVRALVPTLAAVFGPDVVVSQHGADTHAWDPLANLRVTTTAMAAAARVVDAVAHRWAGGRWLATGGGGYEAYRVVPRAWALTWLAGAHREPPERTPEAWRDRWSAEASRFGAQGLPTSFLDEPNAGQEAGSPQRAGEERSLAMLARVRAVALPRLVREAEDRGWWAPALAWAGQELRRRDRDGRGRGGRRPGGRRLAARRPPCAPWRLADLDRSRPGAAGRRTVRPRGRGGAAARGGARRGATGGGGVRLDDRRGRRCRPVRDRARRGVAPGRGRRAAVPGRRAGWRRCSGRSSTDGRHGRRWRRVSAWRSVTWSSRRTSRRASRSPAACWPGPASWSARHPRTWPGTIRGRWSRGCRAPDRARVRGAGAGWAGTGGVGGVRRPPVVLDPRSLRHGHRAATIEDNPRQRTDVDRVEPSSPHRAIGQVPRTAGPQEPAVRLSGRRIATVRTSVRKWRCRLYSASRGRAQQGSARTLRARGAGLVRGDVRGPHAGPGAGLGGDQRGPQHPDPCPHRQRQDPGRVPVVPGPPRRATRGRRRRAGIPGSVRVLYISPLKALAYDVERNLRAPLAGITLAAQRLGQEPPRISIASRTGDTPAAERRDLVRHPPDILVTTPESLYLLLTSQAREILRGVEQVIVDEVHAIAGTKRGAHLALSLERLERLRTGRDGRTTRIDAAARVSRSARSSASACPPPSDRSRPSPASWAAWARAARSPSSTPAPASPSRSRSSSPSRTWPAWARSCPLDEQPGGPVLGGEMRTSIWPAIHPRILELIRAHHSTIVFTNSRRLAERLAQRLNELAGEELVRAHHGSIAREQRLEIEEELKAGRLPALVATSSLELGIDMGAVDLVIQVESPTSVARGLQRIGRAGHHVGEPSKGVIFPKYRGDLLETAVVVRGMRDGRIEPTVLPRNPLDVLAQQLVAMTIGERFTVDELLAIVRRAAPFETLTREVLEGVLGMLAGAYPSDEFAELKPRVTWDRLTDVVEGRQRRARRRGHQRRHDPGPRAVPGVPRGRGGDARSPGGGARRGDGLRAARRDARRRRGPGRQLLAGRGDHGQPGHGDPGPGRAGQAAVLARRRRRAAGGAGQGHRRVRPRRRDRPREGAEGAGAGRRAPAARPRPRRPRRRQPPRLPRGRARGHRRPPDRPPDRHRAVPRRAGRLAARRAHAVRRPRARPVDARDRGAAPGASRPRGPDDLLRRRHRDPAARGRLEPRRGGGAPVPGSRRGRGPGRRARRRVEPVREPVPRERGARPAPAAAAARDPDPALAAAPAGGGPARRGQPVWLLPDPGGDLPRVPGRRLRPAGPARDPGRRAAAGAGRPLGRDGASVRVREQPAVRLRRRLHVRGRRPAWPSAGPRR